MIEKYPTEFSGTLLLDTASDTSPTKLGGAVTLHLRWPFLLPPLDLVPRKGKTINGRARPAILTLPSNEVYLVMSWKMNAPNLSAANHAKILAQYEKAGGGSHLIWGNVTPMSLTETPRLLKSRISSAALDPIFTVLGEPAGGGRWLAQRLLPRRVPYAVRVISPVMLQLFCKL